MAFPQPPARPLLHVQQTNEPASRSLTQTQEVALLMLAVATMCIVGVGILWVCWH